MPLVGKYRGIEVWSSPGRHSKSAQGPFPGQMSAWGRFTSRTPPATLGVVCPGIPPFNPGSGARLAAALYPRDRGRLQEHLAVAQLPFGARDSSCRPACGLENHLFTRSRFTREAPRSPPLALTCSCHWRTSRATPPCYRTFPTSRRVSFQSPPAPPPDSLMSPNSYPGTRHGPSRARRLQRAPPGGRRNHIRSLSAHAGHGTQAPVTRPPGSPRPGAGYGSHGPRHRPHPCIGRSHTIARHRGCGFRAEQDRRLTLGWRNFSPPSGD